MDLEGDLMTSTERVQLEKDILYEYHKASGDFSAQIVKLRLSHSRLQLAADQLKRFIDYVEGGYPIRREGSPSAPSSDLDLNQIESECAELVRLRDRVDQLQADKKGLGL
jgi:hypothetical protein